MKKLLIKTICFTLLLLISITSVAMAASSIEDIHNAKNITELETAMNNASELKDEVTKMNELDKWKKNRILTSLLIRKKYQEDIKSFKELFKAEYTAATTYAKFKEGYPYTTGASANGAYLVVKTDMDCYVYIVAMPENINGGLSSEYELMRFYKNNNNQYKKKVFVQGGLETKIAVSCAAWGNGQEYRIYTCLDVDGNKSAFCKANYKVNDYRYNWHVTYLYDLFYDFFLGYVSLYDIDLIAYLENTYSLEFYIHTYFLDHHISIPFGPYEGEYDSLGEYEYASPAITVEHAYPTVVHATITFKDGTTCHDTFEIHSPY